ncbi:TIGR03086 family metal-binding protein [Jiangella gansuensis]|uniref:TIGR03086 family metal-binding protein n=1 Tax=Jiangella gansuensis TaxID=281473 RepID=UPI00047A3A4F|nr:TIGR03086 family metal-binding protein [Jiangella gansuensis]
MTDITHRYRQLAAALTGRIEAVPANRWDSPSPCEGWSARDVVRHLIQVRHDMPAMVGLTLPAGPSPDDDPAAAWAAARDAMQEILDDPARAGLEYDGMSGRTTLAATIGSFVCFDLVVHGWDIARATGTDETLSAQELQVGWELARAVGDNLRRPGVCGPEVPAPADADEQTRLLAFLGRTA